MNEVVYNSGGAEFCLSKKAYDRLLELGVKQENLFIINNKCYCKKIEPSKQEWTD